MLWKITDTTAYCQSRTRETSDGGSVPSAWHRAEFPGDAIADIQQLQSSFSFFNWV